VVLKRKNIEKHSIKFEKKKLHEQIGKDYQPFLENRDVPSMGKRTRIKSWTVGRTHHLFSNLELGAFLTLDTDPNVVDIREQYPLLPVRVVQQLADDLGVRYSMNGAFHVHTTDFLVTMKNGSHIAYSVKPSTQLKSKRVLEKLALENRFWALNDIQHSIITELDLNQPVINGIAQYHSYRFDWIDSKEHSTDLAIEEAILSAISAHPTTPLSSLCEMVEKSIGTQSGHALRTVKRCLATEKWRLARGHIFDPRIALSLEGGFAA